MPTPRTPPPSEESRRRALVLAAADLVRDTTLTDRSDAARALVRQYRELGEEFPPEALVDLALGKPIGQTTYVGFRNQHKWDLTWLARDWWDGRAPELAPFEARVWDARNIELRLEPSGENGPKKIRGYASVFNSPSQEVWGFIEQVAPNAFDECLARLPDVRALFNHDPNYLLGRTKSGTLRLSVDDKGLLYEIDPPDTQTARELMVLIERGDISQSSFAFIVIKDSWERSSSGPDIRTLLKVDLFDVSPVTYPAYTQATAFVRDWLGASSRFAEELDSGRLGPDQEEVTQVNQIGLYRRRLRLLELEGL